MKAWALLLVSSVALAEPSALEVRRAALDTPSGIVEVTGGCWLSAENCVGKAKELEKLRAENAALREAPQDVQSHLLVGALSLVAGIAFGGWVVTQVRR